MAVLGKRRYRDSGVTYNNLEKVSVGLGNKGEGGFNGGAILGGGGDTATQDLVVRLSTYCT